MKKALCILPFLIVFLSIPLVSTHTMTVPTTVYFGIPIYGTYINFAESQTFDTIYRSGNYWYFDNYALSVQNANMTVNKYFQRGDVLEFDVSASSGTTSTTKVYCGDKGKPGSVSGASSWSYNSTTKILGIVVAHSGSETIEIRWLTGDVNGDGVVDLLDLGEIGKAYGSTLGSPNWDAKCDITGPAGVPDVVVDIYDLAACGKNCGKTADNVQ